MAALLALSVALAQCGKPPVRARNNDRSLSSKTYAWESNDPPSVCGADAGVAADASAMLIEEMDVDESNDQKPKATKGTMSTASAVVRRMQPRIRKCYEDLLQRDRHAHGKVVLSMEIDCRGRITNQTAESTGLDRRVVGCIFEAVRYARFIPPRGGSGTLRVVMRFKR